ncbi:MAG: cytidylate kinase-like family protein [Clostridia bacterium]|nr:cytidylate kinase-like family protein [Clostridia bacterium]
MNIITISREYGAGGHSIGERVAKKLGFDFYDQEIIKEIAEKAGLTTDQVEEEGTLTLADTLIRNITPISYDQKNTIFEYQCEVIKEIASKGPCVILGRCSDAILRNEGIPAFNVFLHASEDSRIKRACELLNTDDIAKVRKIVRHEDHVRRAYYNYYTSLNWGDHRNYSVSLDSGVLGYDGCAELICSAVKYLREE